MNSYANHGDSDSCRAVSPQKTQPPGQRALSRPGGRCQYGMAALEWRGRPRFTDQPQLTMDCLPALKGLVRHSVTRRAEHFLFLPPAVDHLPRERPSKRLSLSCLPEGRWLSRNGGCRKRSLIETERDMSQPSFHNGRLMQAPEVDHHQPSAATTATD